MDGSAGEIWTETLLSEEPTATVYARAPETLTYPPNAAPPEGAMSGCGLGLTKDSPVTVIVNEKLPVWVGMPEMLPVCGLRVSPGGSTPWLTAKW